MDIVGLIKKGYRSSGKLVSDQFIDAFLYGESRNVSSCKVLVVLTRKIEGWKILSIFLTLINSRYSSYQRCCCWQLRHSGGSTQREGPVCEVSWVE